MFQTPQEALNYIKENQIQIVDLKFIDMPGIWQHLSLYHDQIDETAFTDGVPFDGSSIRGWKAINESDMTMVIDPTTAWMDPFMADRPSASFAASKNPARGNRTVAVPAPLPKKP